MQFEVTFEQLRDGAQFTEIRETGYPEYFESEMHEKAVNLDLIVVSITQI